MIRNEGRIKTGEERSRVSQGRKRDGSGQEIVRERIINVIIELNLTGPYGQP